MSFAKCSSKSKFSTKFPLYLCRTLALTERNVKLSTLDFFKVNIYAKISRVMRKYEPSNK